MYDNLIYYLIYQLDRSTVGMVVMVLGWQVWGRAFKSPRGQDFFQLNFSLYKYLINFITLYHCFIAIYKI